MTNPTTMPVDRAFTVESTTMRCAGTRRGADAKTTRCGATLTSSRKPFPKIACPSCGATGKWEAVEG